LSAPVAFDQLEPVAIQRPGDGPSPEQIAAAIEQARAEGFEAGRQAGLASNEARIAVAEDGLRAAAGALVDERGAVADAVERSAVVLALRIAEQAVRSAVDADPERVLDAVQGALRALVERERVLVLVNPEDLEIVRAGLAPLADGLGGIGNFEVQAERRVTRGGAVVRTADGEVDATLETKLERARSVLDDELAHRDR
jgi:flagellar assembly protein FliH